MSARPLSLRACLLVSVGLGVFLSCWATVVFALGGAVDLRRAGLGPVQIVLLYLLGGLGGGLIFWSAQPLRRSKIGGALVGFLSLLPMALGTAALISDLPAVARYAGALMTAALLGGVIGYEETGE